MSVNTPEKEPLARSVILAFDPGAKRCGYARIMKWGDKYSLLDSGILGLDRHKDESFGDYRSRLLVFWAETFPPMLSPQHTVPHRVVFETLPVVGSGTGNAAQRILGQTVITTISVIAHQKGIVVRELAASSIKKKMTGNGRATKVGIRNAVLEVFPELVPRKKELTTYADESDAIAIALVALGYDQNNTTT